MSSQWTDKHEILRDLHEAQGTIPVDIHNTIYTNGRPLNQCLSEENEINVTHGCHDVEFESGPDLQLIKQMLDMVRQASTSREIISVNPERYEICKINRQLNTVLCKTQKIDNKTSIEEVKAPKVRRQRNVALASILEAISTRNSMDDNPCENLGTVSVQKTETHMKLLKPDDFIMKDDPNATTEEVCCSLIDVSSPNVTSILFNNNSPKTELKTFESYKPSVMADLYYNNYLERSKLKSVQQNFMRETEKLIKIVDLKEPEVLCLTQHRHSLTEECIVCKILCKKHI